MSIWPPPPSDADLLARLDTLGVGLAALGADGVLDRMNAAVAHLLALPDGVRRFDLSKIRWTSLTGVECSVVDRLLDGHEVNEILQADLPSGQRARCWVHGTVVSGRADLRAWLCLVDLAEHALSPAEASAQVQMYRNLAEHLADVVLVMKEEVITWASRSAQFVLGYHPIDLVGRAAPSLIHPDDMHDLVVTRQNPIQAGVSRMLKADGTFAWMEFKLMAHFADDGAVTVYGIMRDISETMRHKSMLAKAHAETDAARAALHAALNATSDGFVVFAVTHEISGQVRDLRVVHANTAARARCGLETDDLLDPLRVRTKAIPLISDLWDDMAAAWREPGPRQRRVHRHHEDGTWMASFDTTIAPDGPERLVLTFRDATADERNSRQMDEIRRRAEYDASHDALTGLANRSLLMLRLEHALAECGRGQRVAVAFCDLNGFKSINDTWGHQAGDAVLKAVAYRLESLLRSSDTAGRLSGDEFVIVCRYLNVSWDGNAFRTRLLDSIARPVAVAGSVVVPSASLGVVIVDPHGQDERDRDPTLVLADADRAMYLHKNTSRIQR